MEDEEEQELAETYNVSDMTYSLVHVALPLAECVLAYSCQKTRCAIRNIRITSRSSLSAIS